MCDNYSVFKIDLHLFEILESCEYQYFIVETNDVRGDLTNVSANSRALVCRSVLLLSKSNKLFFGYFDPENIFLDNKNK